MSRIIGKTDVNLKLLGESPIFSIFVGLFKNLCKRYQYEYSILEVGIQQCSQILNQNPALPLLIQNRYLAYNFEL